MKITPWLGQKTRNITNGHRYLHTYCYVPFVYPLTLSYRRGQGSSAALHMESLAVGSHYQAACDRAYHGVIAIGHW